MQIKHLLLAQKKHTRSVLCIIWHMALMGGDRALAIARAAVALRNHEIIEGGEKGVLGRGGKELHYGKRDVIVQQML